MKKLIIVFTVFAVALGITLIASGIWVCSGFGKFDEESADNFGYLIAYGFMLIIGFFFVIMILLGIPFLFTGPIALIAFFQEDLLRIRRHIRITVSINTPLLILILICVLNSIGMFFNWEDKTLTAFKLMVLLITALSLALEIVAIIASKKVKKSIIEQGRSR